MKGTKILIGIFLIIAMLFCFAGCKPNSNLIVRFDFNEDDIDSLYKNMLENEVFALLGLPHRTKEYIDTSSYDYYNDKGILRVEFEYRKLKEATFFGKVDAKQIQLKDKKTVEIDSNRYLQEIDTHIMSDEVEFINKDLNSEKIQSVIGPPHYYVDYDIGGLLLNAFCYDLKDGNKLVIIYKPNGTVGMAQIQDNDGEILKSIVEFEE